MVCNATNLWVTNSYPLGFSFKDDTSAIPVGVSPLDNGTKFRVVEFPPLDAATEAKMEPELSDEGSRPRGAGQRHPVTHPLMHRTRSVDYAVVLSGEIDMMLDDTWSISSPAIRSCSRPPIMHGSITEPRRAGSCSC